MRPRDQRNGLSFGTFPSSPNRRFVSGYGQAKNCVAPKVIAWSPTHRLRLHTSEDERQSALSLRLQLGRKPAHHASSEILEERPQRSTVCSMIPSSRDAELVTIHIIDPKRRRGCMAIQRISHLWRNSKAQQVNGWSSLRFLLS